MRCRSPVWWLLIVGIVTTVLGFIGFYTLIPEKTDAPIPAMLSLLLFMVGLLFVVGSLIVAIVVAIRHSSRRRHGVATRAMS